MQKILCITLLTLVISACSSGQNANTLPATATSDDARVAALTQDNNSTSILKLLTKQIVIGSTIDPVNGDKSPAGLTIIPKASGNLKKDALVACNSANKSGTAGQGSTLEQLAPTAGAKVARFVQSSDLLGCAGVAFAAGQTLVYAAAPTAKSAVPVSATGQVDTGMIVKTGLSKPFGTVYGSNSTNPDFYASDGLWIGDVATGSIVLEFWEPSGGAREVGPVITGLPVGHTKTGSALGPASLMFRLSGNDNTVYALDSANSTLYAFGSACGKAVAPATNIVEPKDIVVGANGKTFSGTFASAGCVVHSGAPLATPIAGTMLYNGNFVIANAGTNGENSLVELSPTGATLDTVTVDKGDAGAIGGLAATGTTAATTKLFFTDKNQNNIQALEK
jgi:hypothetical protein